MIKKKFSVHEIAALENFSLTVDYNNVPVKDVVEKIASKMNSKNYPWFKDFSHILDNESNVYYDICHVWSHGNQIIAQHIFDLIKNDLIEISRKSN